MTPCRELPLNTAVLILLTFCALATSATARHRKSPDAEPGTFDYYLLSLSWSPAYCLSDPGAAECNGPRRFGFIVHGLWPQYVPRLREVHICLDRDLNRRACSADVARGACRAATLIVPPIR